MRKAFLALMLGLVLVTSGCMGGSSEPAENGESPDPDTPADTPGEEEGDESPDFEVVSFDTSEDPVLLGNNVTLMAEVENSGGEGSFYEGISISRERFDFEDPEGVNQFNGSIEAGETRTFTWEMRAASVGTWKFHLGEDNTTTTFSTVPRNLSLGESYENARDLSMTIESFELKDQYTAEGEEVSSSGDQYLFLEYTVENLGEDPKRQFSVGNIYVTADGERYENRYYAEDASSYEEFDVFEPLAPGDTRTGYLGYKIPADLERNDVTVLWSETLGYNTKKNYWHR